MLPPPQGSNSESSSGWWGGKERSILSLPSPGSPEASVRGGGRRFQTHMSGVEGGNDWLLLEIDAAILHLEFNLDHLEQSRELVCVLRRDDALAPHIVIDRHHEETVLLAHHLHRVNRNVFLKEIGQKRQREQGSR
jgi:hypothetical protein